MKRNKKDGLAMLKGVMALVQAYRDIEKRAQGVPGMMLVHGVSGAGKTTAADYVCKQLDGVWMRAMSLETPVSFLSRLCLMCGQTPNPSRGNTKMVEQVAEYLKNNDLPLFVDEADYLLKKVSMIETVRDIHDLSDQPVILIGHAGIDKRFSHLRQVERRISSWINIPPADLEDADILAKYLCEVKVGDDLIEKLHRDCQGSIGLMTVGLARIQAVAKTQGLSKIDAEVWGDRRKFFVTQSVRPSI